MKETLPAIIGTQYAFQQTGSVKVLIGRYTRTCFILSHLTRLVLVVVALGLPKAIILPPPPVEIAASSKPGSGRRMFPFLGS
jgi:hypothetical protein